MTGQSQWLQQVPHWRRKLTKTATLDYFNKNLSSPRFFEINTSNFQEMFLDIFKKFCQKELKKIIIKINKKNVFFMFFCKKNYFVHFKKFLPAEKLLILNKSRKCLK